MNSYIVLYGIPLTVCISLVYNASRFELPSRILSAAVVFFLKTFIGLVVLYGVLWYASL